MRQADGVGRRVESPLAPGHHSRPAPYLSSEGGFRLVTGIASGTKLARSGCFELDADSLNVDDLERRMGRILLQQSILRAADLTHLDHRADV